MAPENLRLLAVLLAIPLFGTSCSAPIDTSSRVSNGPANVEVAPASGPAISSVKSPSASEPQEQRPQSVAEQRTEALLAHWLANARKLRASGELEAARLELLQAKEIAPRNQTVAAELAAVIAEIGVPAGRIWEGGIRQPAIAEQRARAVVQFHLKSAQQRMTDKDYAGAIDELRKAELEIKLKNDIDWGDLPAQVQVALKKAEGLNDAQAPESNMPCVSGLRTPSRDMDPRLCVADR